MSKKKLLVHHGNTHPLGTKCKICDGVKKEGMTDREKEFEEKLDADNPDGFRYSTRVEPRLADAEKVKKWLTKRDQKMAKALRMKEKEVKETFSHLDDMRVYGYNKAVEEFNQKLDSYLKKQEGR